MSDKLSVKNMSPEELSRARSTLGAQTWREIGEWSDELGLDRLWIWRLLEHDLDDWSLSVKLAALVEDAVCDTLLACIRPPEDAVNAVKLEHGKRITKLCKVNLISESAADGLRAIAAVRNGYAHSIRRIAKPMSSFLDRSTNEGLARFNQLKDSYVPQPLDTPIDRQHFVETQPRAALFIAAISALLELRSSMKRASAP